MDRVEAYDKACELWGDGVALEVEGRFIIGRWIPTMDACGPYILSSKTKAVEVLGEGVSWAHAYNQALLHHGPKPVLCVSCELPLGDMGWCDRCDEAE